MSKDQEHPLKEHLNVYGPAIIITLLGLIFAYQFVDPAPPDRIRIASGHEEGAYHLFARRYRDYLTQEGIELEIVTSAGSVENIQLLESEQVDVAFVQGGLASNATAGALLSLGSFYYEPIWLFHRGELEINRLTGLKQRRVAVGAERSGTRALALQLLSDNKLNDDNTKILAIGGNEAADALLAGEIDAAFFVASSESPVVLRLLESEALKLMNFERADAYTRLHPYLSSVVLPEGVVDMERNLPDRETRLLSATANLVISDRLHPAIVELLVYVGGKIHGAGGWFEERGEFPTPAFSDFPLSEDAAHFYQQGPSFLQRYLPFWTASLLDRLKVMLLPLVALLLPLTKVMPSIYNWRMRLRIYPWYREVLAIDRSLAEQKPDLAGALEALNSIERQVTDISVPLSFARELYDLHQHISLVRGRLEQRREKTGAAE